MATRSVVPVRVPIRLGESRVPSARVHRTARDHVLHQRHGAKIRDEQARVQPAGETLEAGV